MQRGRGALLGEGELGEGGLGDLLADVARLVERPVVELVGLGLLHRLDEVVVLDLADAEESGEEGHGDGHPGAQPARRGALAFQLFSRRGRRFHRVDVHRTGFR